MKPVQRADSTPKGKLKNPYSDSNKAIVAAGNKLFQGASCSGCHGGTGGGGICPPLANGVWIYGGDDDTLFRLIRCQRWETWSERTMIYGASSPSFARNTMDQPSVSSVARRRRE
jgi:mono/diheme cytochrome c family protein